MSATALAIAFAVSGCALATVPVPNPRHDGAIDTTSADANDATAQDIAPGDTGPAGCTADSQCSSPLPYCDAATHACVACRTSGDCPTSAPHCASGVCAATCTVSTDCNAAACQTCTGGICVSRCAGGQVCDGHGGCSCPSPMRDCAGTCIGASSCCATSDCASGMTCPAPGGVCSCPSGTHACGAMCIGAGHCCTSADCSTGMACSGAGGTCQCAPGTCAGACASSCGAGHSCSGGVCVACGGAGQACCAGSVCSAGTCVGGSCAGFGGAYQTNDAPCGACNNANSFTGGCSCPSGTSALVGLRTIDDCAGGGMQTGATVTFCGTGTYAGGDFGGAYQIDDPVGCALGCRVANPYTGGCTCPSGTTEISMRTLVANSCGGIIGSHFVLCLHGSATRTSFGGAYEVDDPAPGGVGCRTANPVTGGCSCPSGTSPHGVRVEVDTPSFIGAMLFVCTP